MPKISVMTFVFGGALSKGELTDRAMLEAVEAMGLNGVELPSSRLLEEPARLDEYKAYLKNSRLEVACIDGMCNFVSREPAARQKGIDDLRRSLDLAAQLSCPIVLAAGSRLSDDIAPAEGRSMIADGLNACMPAAKDAGITLSIEDFGVAPTLQCAAADCLEVMELAPGVAFVFDTGNFYFAGEDALDNFDVLAPRTCHVHFKDWIKSDQPAIADVAGCPLGVGLVRNEAVAERFLATTGFDSVSLEVEAPGDKLEATRQDLETIRQWLEQET